MSWKKKIFPDRSDAELVVFGNELSTLTPKNIPALNRRLKDWIKSQRPAISMHLSTESLDISADFPPADPDRYQYPVFEEIVLRSRIWLLSSDPLYPINWTEYPKAFSAFYHKAAFRDFALTEFERFTPLVEHLYHSNKLLAAFAEYDPEQKPHWFIDSFYEKMITLYVDSYRFEDALRLSMKLIARGDAHRPQLDLFRKMNRIEDGVLLLKSLRDNPPRKDYSTDWIADAITLLRRQQDYLKPYKPRQKKPTSLADESTLIRYEGHLPSIGGGKETE